MSKFEDALQMSFDAYVDSLPEPDEVPKHKFSKKHTDAINAIIYPRPDVKVKKTPRKIIRFIIIAAILLSLAVTAVATNVSRSYVIEKSPNRVVYRVENTKNMPRRTPLKVGYVPKGFDKSGQYKKEEYVYSKLDKHFVVDKYTLDEDVGILGDYNEEIEINGAKAVFYKTPNNNGIIFNNGKYIFEVMGNIDKDELVKIAQSVE